MMFKDSNGIMQYVPYSKQTPEQRRASNEQRKAASLKARNAARVRMGLPRLLDHSGTIDPRDARLRLVKAPPDA